MDLIRLFSDGFPLTIERLRFLQQTYTKAISQLTKIAGNGNMILDGVVRSGSGVSSGVIVVNGEVLEFQGGTYVDRVAIFETVDEVPYNVDADNDGNLDLKAADVVRTARCAGSGGVDSFQFSSLVRVGSLQTNKFPIGTILPFDGDINNLPPGWELYNLANKFIMGAGGTNSLGSTGGQNSYSIQRANVPNFTMTGSTTLGGAHQHDYRDGYYIDSFESPNDSVNGYDSEFVGNGFRGSASTDADNRYIWYKDRKTTFSDAHTHNVSVNTGGSGSPIDNRPEFVALNFIRFVGL